MGRLTRCLAALVAGLLVGGTAAGKTLGEYKVEGVRAYFVSHKTGKIEPEDAVKESGWNRFLDAEAAVILVDLSGPKFPMGNGASIELRATSGGRQLEHKWLPMTDHYFTESGRTTVPFLVYNMQCSPVEVRVVLRGRGTRAEGKATIRLACGE